MKKIMRCTAAVMLLALIAVSFSACGPDESIEERLFGRSWAGDIGLNDEYGYSLYSVFQFLPDGTGWEYSYYQDNDERYNTYQFYWQWDGRGTNIILDYGGNYVSYMENVYVGGGEMTGIYYNDYYSNAPGVRFRLEAGY
ncbi:MAG: hypothetical protein LBN29_10185 [Mediterranea sp.]|jgi:hypothetical protein|nr:hypothetical protein [Mediterranea sp.]